MLTRIAAAGLVASVVVGAAPAATGTVRAP